MPMKSAFTIPIVEECPHTTTGGGIIRLTHGVIATLAGAVHDKDEWMALLQGTRSEDGLDITVTGFYIPKQTRSHGNCELVNLEPLTPNIVGVVHSHHSMGAFFSATDDNELNPKFPMSIVVAQLKPNSDEEEQLLGFSYQAEARAVLPCGSVGIIPCVALPTPELPAWPLQPILGFAEPDVEVTLYHCPHNERTLKGVTFSCHTKCGIKTIAKGKAIFGRDGKKFMREVEAATQASKWNNQGVNGGVIYYGGHGKHYGKWDEKDRIPHWSQITE